MSEAIPSRLPARVLDLGNYSLSNLYVLQIHLVLDFDGRIEPDRLRRALRLVLDAEPVLGCRFVPRWVEPFWSRIPGEELDRADLLLVEQGDAAACEAALSRFLALPLDSRVEPGVKSLLISRASGDCLVLKVSHMIADAGGTKEVGYLLASLYRRLASDPQFRPPPRLGSRSLKQVYGRFLPRHFFGIMRRQVRDVRNNSFPLKTTLFPSGNEAKGPWTFVFRHFSPERVARLKSHGARTEATLNDMVVTALVRAIARTTSWKGERPLRMAGTVDLRRYVPGGRADGICNLSALFFAPRFDGDIGAGFDDTLAEVKKQLDLAKSDYLGLGFALATYLITLPFPFAVKARMMRGTFKLIGRAENLMPSFTNMGPIDEGDLDFGSPAPVSAYLATPPVYPPFFVCGLSGFRGALTLSAGFFESAVPRAEMERFFDLVDEELPR